MQREGFEVLFTEEVPWGVVAGVALPPVGQADCWRLAQQLTVEEARFARACSPMRQPSWIGGRLALRAAALRLGVALGTVLSTPRGAPDLSRPLIGSIAHKTKLAVAVLGRIGPGQPAFQLGVDLEEWLPRRDVIGRMVLVGQERAYVDSLAYEHQWDATVRVFCVKEALFKALDPFLQRYIGFQEACVNLERPHEPLVRLQLKHNEGPFSVSVLAKSTHDHLLTIVQAAPAGNAQPSGLP